MASVLSPGPVMVPRFRPRRGYCEHEVGGGTQARDAPCRATGLFLGEQHVDEIGGATSSSAATPQPEILKSCYEIDALSMERNDFLCSVMPGMKVYDSIMDVQNCCDKVVTQMGDDPEDQDDPLAPQSGDTKDKGKQPAIAHDRNHDFNARNNDKTKDAMTGASSQY